MKDYGLLSHLPPYPIYPIINSGQDGLSEREKKFKKWACQQFEIF